jgi:hypothetical protein
MLTDKQRKQLEANIQKMLDGGATEEDVKQYAKDFIEYLSKDAKQSDSNVLPTWVPNCLKVGSSNKLIPTKDKNLVAFRGTNYILGFYKNYRVTFRYNNDDTPIKGKWGCKSTENKYIIYLENGFVWNGSKWFSWSNYPCVVELAKQKGIERSSNNSYTIDEITYYINGRKHSKTGKGNFTCNDPEFNSITTDSSNDNQITQPLIPSELNNSEGVKNFQDWLDQNKKDWATGYPSGVLNKRKGYGRFGPRTQKAWELYKNEYLKQSPTDGGDIQQSNVVVAKPEQETRGAEYKQKSAQMKTDSDSLNQPLRQSSNKETIYSNKEPDFKGSPINVMNNEI